MKVWSDSDHSLAYSRKIKSRQRKSEMGVRRSNATTTQRSKNDRV